MQYAINTDGLRVEASKGIVAVCPNCRERVIAKCGKIRIRHWAHTAGDDCDPWYEPETEWHRAWKQLFADDLVEVPLGPHRADIRNNSGLVVELQNSPISTTDIIARERFYKNMIWIVNAEKFASRFFLLRVLGGGLFTFKWKNMKPSWLYAKMPLYFDFGEFTVEDLFGAKNQWSSEFYNSEGELEYRQHTSIERYSVPNTPSRATPENSTGNNFATLSDAVLRCSILKVNTLREKGYGSAKAVSNAGLYRLCGADKSRTFNLEAFK